jgi:hypothetical protein
MKSVIRTELEKEVKNNIRDDELAQRFVECIDKLPLELVRQFLTRFLELKTTEKTIELDLLAVISQQEE